MLDMETTQLLTAVMLGLMAVLSTVLGALLLYGLAAIIRIAYYEIKNLLKRKE